MDARQAVVEKDLPPEGDLRFLAAVRNDMGKVGMTPPSCHSEERLPSLSFRGAHAPLVIPRRTRPSCHSEARTPRNLRRMDARQVVVEKDLPPEGDLRFLTAVRNDMGKVGMTLPSCHSEAHTPLLSFRGVPSLPVILRCSSPPCHSEARLPSLSFRGAHAEESKAHGRPPGRRRKGPANRGRP